MDPATIIGVVSGILTFVGTAEKILKLSWTIYNSVEGSSEEIGLRLKLNDAMADIIKKRLFLPDQPTQTEEDKPLVNLVQECNRLTNDIGKALQTLRPIKRKSKRQSCLAALKALRAEPKLKSLEGQLQRCRDQLHFYLASLSR